MSARSAVAVIMRAKNSAWVIDQALASLHAQSFRDFELHVVDSGSTDGTLAMIAAYPCHLHRIAASDYYPGAVLNDAIARTSSELVVFQNSDVVPLGHEALSRLVAAFDDPSVDAAFARQVPRPDAHTWVARDYAVSFPSSGEPPPWLPFSLPFAAMRRAAWLRHPFYVDAWGSEDTEWGHWARRSGSNVRYVSDAVVMHSHNYTLRQLVGRRFIEGEADAFIYGGRDSLGAVVRRIAASLWHDAREHVRAGDVAGLLMSPARRSVYHWAYHRGHVHGEARRRVNDRDASVGQRVVLQRYG